MVLSCAGRCRATSCRIFLILDHGRHVRPHGNIMRGVRVRRKNIAQFGVHRDAVTRQIGQSAPDRRRSGVGQYADLNTVFCSSGCIHASRAPNGYAKNSTFFWLVFLRDEVDALLEVLTDALVIRRRLRFALQPLDAVDAVRCGQSAVLRVIAGCRCERPAPPDRCQPFRLPHPT